MRAEPFDDAAIPFAALWRLWQSRSHGKKKRKTSAVGAATPYLVLFAASASA